MFSWLWKRPDADDVLNPKQAMHYFRKAKYDEALRRAEAIVVAGPLIALSWRFQAECLFHVHRYLDAAESFAQAIQLGGVGTEDLHVWRAMSLFNGGQPQGALQVLRDYLASGVGKPELVEQAQNALTKMEARASTLNIPVDPNSEVR